MAYSGRLALTGAYVTIAVDFSFFVGLGLGSLTGISNIIGAGYGCCTGRKSLT